MPPTISAAFFPHIIDSIFELASSDALLYLRVCKDWKRRVDARLYHVSLTEVAADTRYPMTTTYALNAGQTGALQTLKTTPYGKCEPAPPSYLSKTAVIDLHVPTFKSDIRRILAAAPPDATYRIHEYCNLWSTASWRPQCLVLFAKDLGPDSAVSDLTKYGLRALRGCSKLVIHVRYAGRGLSTFPGPLFIKDMTVVVHPRKDVDGVCDSVEDAPAVGLLADLGMLGYASNVRTTFVMMNECSEDERPWDEDTVNVTSRRIRRWMELIKPGSSAHAGVFLTEDEYRAQVGEVQFEIEMNEGRVSPPAGWWSDFGATG